MSSNSQFYKAFFKSTSVEDASRILKEKYEAERIERGDANTYNACVRWRTRWNNKNPNKLTLPSMKEMGIDYQKNMVTTTTTTESETQTETQTPPPVERFNASTQTDMPDHLEDLKKMFAIMRQQLDQTNEMMKIVMSVVEEL